MKDNMHVYVLCTVYTGVHTYVKALHGLDSVGFCSLIMCVPYLINNIEARISDIPVARLVQSAF